MSWVDLGVPRPREVPIPYNPVTWTNRIIRELDTPTAFPDTCFADVVLTRRTRRQFGPISQADLSSFFWLSCRTQKNAESDSGLPLAQRPVPSAGALHPIHVLINQPSDSNWWRYDPDDHSLNAVERSDVLSELRFEADGLVEIGSGILLLLVAEPGKSFTKYEDATGLIWRDAGVLLGQFALVSEALGLNFCALGITGAPWASDLDESGRLAGVGLGVLGAPT